MANDIVRHDIQGLIDGWLDAERNGERFPVPFDLAWTIAGYARKDHAKRKLLSDGSGLIGDEDFAFLKSGEWSQDGRSSDLIVMTCDAFKQFCLMAKTEQGKQIRLYFIEAEKKWKLVQQVAPQMASEIEALHLKLEIAKLEAQKEQSIATAKEADERILKFRHIVTTTMPEPQQQKILGFEVIKEVEYRDRVIHNDDLINDGSTILKTDLCYRYGLLTRSGKPDYKKLNTVLQDLPGDAFELTVRLQDNRELRREWLPQLDRVIDSGSRNFHLGE